MYEKEVTDSYGAMYLSHPVRRMREDPLEGEEVTLVVRVTVDDPGGGVGEVTEEAIEAAVSDIERAGGTAEDHLRFGALRVRIRQERLDDLCSVPGLASVETDNTIGLGGDAGEDG